MSAPRMTKDDVGSLYEGPGHTVWQLVSYADRPTASLERVFPLPTGSDERRSGVVGSPVFDGFVRLVRDERVARCAYPGCPSDELAVAGQTSATAGMPFAVKVFVCPRHDGWLREDACEYLDFRVTY